MQEMETRSPGKGVPPLNLFFHLSRLFVIFRISRVEGMQPASTRYAMYLETDGRVCVS